MLQYARKLAPDNLEVLRLLGRPPTSSARRARRSRRCRRRSTSPARQGAAGVTGRLGIIYLRLGKLDDAIRYLRMRRRDRSSPGRPITGAHARPSRRTRSRRAARRARRSTCSRTRSRAVPYYSTELAAGRFALAVQYDRDEQRGAAFEVLDRMQTMLQGQLATMVQTALARMRFAPAEDQHYYLRPLVRGRRQLHRGARGMGALCAAAKTAVSPARARAHRRARALRRPCRRPPPP